MEVLLQTQQTRVTSPWTPLAPNTLIERTTQSTIWYSYLLLRERSNTIPIRLPGCIVYSARCGT